MTDFAPEGSFGTGQTNTITERSGAAIGVDTVPAGATVLARNTGVGVHTVILVNSATQDGLPVSNRTHNFAASGVRAFLVPASYGDANGRVNLYVGEGTQAEIKYYILGT
jgi:hypothetical protein